MGAGDIGERQGLNNAHRVSAADVAERDVAVLSGEMDGMSAASLSAQRAERSKE